MSMARTNGSPPRVENAAPSERRTFSVKNPANGELIRELPDCTREEVFAEMERARRAAPTWAALSIAERCSRLDKVARTIARRADEIAAVVMRENGKARFEA